MAKKCNAEVWILVDDGGDYTVAKTPKEAREKYEEDIQELNQAGVFRLIQLNVSVPLPEPIVVVMDITETEAVPVPVPVVTVATEGVQQ